MYCPKCGQNNPGTETTCLNCGSVLAGSAVAVELEKPENVLNGILGALIGALIGGASIVLLGMINTVSAISGVILAFCTLKGYELLGGKLSKVGIAISAVLILVMPFCGYLVSSGIGIINEVKEYLPDLTLMESIQLMFAMVEYDPELKGVLVSELLQLYLFNGLGVVIFFIDRKKRSKK